MRNLNDESPQMRGLDVTITFHLYADVFFISVSVVILGEFITFPQVYILIVSIILPQLKRLVEGWMTIIISCYA